MKKEVRKALAISGLAIALGTSGLTLDANASMINGRNTHFEKQIKKTSATYNKSNNLSGFLHRHRRIMPGVVTAITDNSLTITRGNKNFTVNTTGATRFLNLKWETMVFSDIKVGDKVRIAGTITGTTIAANTVRDISL